MKPMRSNESLRSVHLIASSYLFFSVAPRNEKTVQPQVLTYTILTVRRPALKGLMNLPSLLLQDRHARNVDDTRWAKSGTFSF